MRFVRTIRNTCAAGVLALLLLHPFHAQAVGSLGDVNGDDAVNANDATMILIDAARTGTGAASWLSPAQRTAADANGDGRVNANDASEVLVYSAKRGSGGTTDSFAAYMHGKTSPVQLSVEDEILLLVNEQRAAYGLPALRADPRIRDAAALRAGEIIGSFSHVRPDGRICHSVLDDLGIRHFSSGENIACGYLDAAGVMDLWMNSPGHRANILDPDFRYIGIGVEGNGMRYFVQIFTG